MDASAFVVAPISGGLWDIARERREKLETAGS
jgi:hypothetical protein